MSMQTDVIATTVESSGTAFAGRTRLKALYVMPDVGGAGTVELIDGGASGVSKFSVSVVTEPQYILIPGEGVLFRTDLYVSLTGGATATVFYG